jgi:hypothetical protein
VIIQTSLPNVYFLIISPLFVVSYSYFSGKRILGLMLGTITPLIIGINAENQWAN